MSAWMCACESTWERTNEWVQKRFTSTARKRTITTATHRFSHGLSTHNDQTQHNTIQLWDRLRYFFSSFNNLNHFPRILFPFLHNPLCRSLTECCHPLKTTQTRKQTSQQQQQQQPKIIIYAYLLRLIMMHRNNEKVSHYITHTHTYTHKKPLNVNTTSTIGSDALWISTTFNIGMEKYESNHYLTAGDL